MKNIAILFVSIILAFVSVVFLFTILNFLGIFTCLGLPSLTVYFVMYICAQVLHPESFYILLISVVVFTVVWFLILSVRKVRNVV